MIGQVKDKTDQDPANTSIPAWLEDYKRLRSQRIPVVVICRDHIHVPRPTVYYTLKRLREAGIDVGAA